MSSEKLGLVPTQNGLNSQLVFQDENLRFNCGAPPQRRVGDSGPKTRELSGFIDDRFFAPQSADFRPSMYNENPDRREPPEPRNWNSNGADTTPSGEGSDEDDDDDDDEDDVDDDDEVDEGDAEVGGLVGVDNRNKGIASNNGNNGEDKMGNGKVKHHNQHHSSFGGTVIVGSSREVLVKDHSVGQQIMNNNTRASPSDTQQGRLGNYHNVVTVAEPDGDIYYSQYLQGSEGSGSAQKDSVVENGCGFSGRKDVMYSSESGDSLRAILSDPVTGALMDDAMILPCGHSFGGSGIQHVIRMKACYTCSQSISEDSIAPNLSLRAAVLAFRREEELQFYRSSKRRRERFDQEKGGYSDSVLVDTPRGRGVQFPFVVTDRVIIKGNKRTPQRFVGREAVVTTQCLNGWYVVKTLDNAESVKLQYRSLAKVSDEPSSKPMSSKMGPNWL
ncbi:PREDICTED: U-box domain-containing protein 62-like isoform X1 [Prunus mume]|uniref:U-box domain-containing protein 62-like isoform X1 n=1 Tax=Prunus mume TaxID=102107 RepID=A0ABM0P3K1_PRUMU|nr:PREDICTED: U-box domain-containing protein 62-like isoform X1 [Prunus mume]